MNASRLKLFLAVWLAAMVLLVGVRLVLAADRGGTDSPQEPSASSSATRETVPASEDSEAGQPSAESGADSQAESDAFTVRLGFAGDICLADNYQAMERLAQLNSTNISDGIDDGFADIMRAMDLMWVNNEFVYSDRGEPLYGKAYTFRGTPANVRYLRDLGVDIVGLANNHTYDYGEEAFLDTLQTLEDIGIPYVGAGRTLAEAKAPVYLEAGGLTIAYVAASCAEYTIYTPQATDTEPGILWCYDNTLFLESIREAAQHADYVIALPHWGIEHSTMLDENQLAGAPACIDAGADAVVGAHAHNLQGIEYYNGKPIFYNLGNFWFDSYDEDTMVAELRISGQRDTHGNATMEGAKVEAIVHPGTQVNVFTSYAAAAQEQRRIFDSLEAMSTNVSIDDDGVVHQL